MTGKQDQRIWDEGKIAGGDETAVQALARERASEAEDRRERTPLSDLQYEFGLKQKCSFIVTVKNSEN